MKVSAYQRPESLLLIVQNRNGGVSKSVQIRFNPQGVLSYGVDAAKAGDVETQRRKENGAVVIRPLHPDFTCALRAEGGNWVLDAGSISPRDFRMVSIARKHVPQGGDPHE